MNTKYNKLDALEQLLANLYKYLELVADCLDNKASHEERRTAFTLNSEIVSSLGYLQNLVNGLCVPFAANMTNEWFKALKLPINTEARNALLVCIQATNKAIGKMKNDIEIGKRNKLGILKNNNETSSKPPKAFIAHGGRSGILDKLREFVEALGIKPIIVELSASKGMSVDDKVNNYIKDADCGIVLATKGGIIDTKSKKPIQHPRLNVIDELERLRAAFPEKTILLVERGVDLPSNISGLTYEPFVGQSMDRAFSAIARELVSFSILRAMKPTKEQKS